MRLPQLTQLSTRIWILLIIGLAFAARLYRLDAQSLWFDEIVTVALARASWYDGLVGLLGQGIQLTPLFHWVIKLWMPVGDTDWLLRLPAVIVGVLTVPMVFKLGQHFFDDRIGVLAAFIFAINPYQVWYGQELRLYTLLTFSAAGAMLAFSQVLRTKGRRGLGALAIYNLIGFSTHYFMFLISAVQFLYLIITFKRTHLLLRRWIITQIIGVLPLIPWWLFIIRQQHFAVGVGWIPRPHWFDPFLTLWNLSFAYTGELSPAIIVILTVMVVALALGLRRIWRKPNEGVLLTLWLFFPPIITVLMSFRYISFYVDRYLLIIAPVLTVLTVGGLLNIRYQALRWGLSLIFVVATGLGLWRVYFDQTNFAKEDWRSVARQVDSQAQVEDAVIVCTDGHHLSFEYYNPHRVLKASDVLVGSQLLDISRLRSYQAVWVINVLESPSPTHYFAKALSPNLDKTLILPEAAAWEIDNLQYEIAVPGISAFRYNLAAPGPLLEIVKWHCRS